MKWVTRIVQGLIALAFIMSGFLKLAGDAMQVKSFTEDYNYGLTMMYLVGAVEVLAGIGLIIGYWKPRIAVYSAIVVAIIMAGAVFSILSAGQGLGLAMVPLIFLLLAILVAVRYSKEPTRNGTTLTR
ncbi:hypothetical protein SY83_05175 [Paenibacillus swuensis]|uniref:DoxX family protein n=1 Tax=Paenibacillus swuensis TaxID=1178515 RepID=A0A172TFK3_9BACL|nr:DoxX family protein [Paenibacillus swuensis]ANE45790.1 hypothetical protein SY83_05175 [Paenibacillus swuensis]